MTQHEVITQIRDAITTGDYGLAVRALNEYRDFEISRIYVSNDWDEKEIDKRAKELYDGIEKQKSLNKQ